MSEVHKCPVCNGRQFVPAGFYQTGLCLTVASLIDEKCQSCDGKGIIIIQSEGDKKINNEEL
jgi:hypothetical protein